MSKNASRLLRILADDEGYDSVWDMLEEAAADSVCLAICTTPGCETVHETEPDQDEGYCDACGKNSVQSVLILAGLI